MRDDVRMIIWAVIISSITILVTNNSFIRIGYEEGVSRSIKIENENKKMDEKIEKIRSILRDYKYCDRLVIQKLKEVM